MSEHTPGQWEAGYGRGVSGPRVSPVCYLDEDAHIAQVPIRVGNQGVAWVLHDCDTADEVPDAEESLLPDARLIAAAPDLLDACRDALAYICDNDGESGVEFVTLLPKLDAAILKATGGTR